MYNGYEPRIKPKYLLYNNQFINTTIIPDKWISIILPIIIERLIDIFILTNVMEYPAVRGK